MFACVPVWVCLCDVCAVVLSVCGGACVPVSACVYVSACICISVCTCVHLYLCACVCMTVFECALVSLCVSVCMSASMFCMCMCTPVCVYVHPCVCVHASVHTFIFLCMFICVSACLMHANMFIPLCTHMLCLAPVCMCVVFMCVCAYVYIRMHMSAQIPKVKCQLIRMNLEVWQTVMKCGYLCVTILGFAFPHIAQCVFFVCTWTVCVCERYALIRSCQQAHGSCLRLYVLVGADVNLYEHICIRILYIYAVVQQDHIK